MDKRSDESLRDRQLAFIGRVMAGVSHEFKNHLAIINESSGLVDDLLRAQVPEENPLYGRLRKIFATIEGRVVQAADLARYLNRFAHRMDQPCSSFSVREVLEEELSFLLRFARQKNITLTLSPPGEGPSAIYNNPALLQLVVACLVDYFLSQLEMGATVEVSVEGHLDRVAIILRAGARVPATVSTPDSAALEAPFLLNALQALQATLSPCKEPNPLSLHLSVPSLL